MTIAVNLVTFSVTMRRHLGNSIERTVKRGLGDGIRRINFRYDSSEIAQLLKRSFQTTFSVQGIDFERYVKLADKRYVRFILTLLNPFLTRFAEVFVWAKDGELLGTGTVQRIHFSDKTRWILSGYAINRERATSFAGVVTMRSLLRKAINHASLNGATEVYAYIRKGNEAPYTICAKEGFQEAEEFSYYMISPSKIEALQETTPTSPRIRATRIKTTVMGWMLRSLVGYEKARFTVHLNSSTIAEVEVLTHTKSSSPSKVEIQPLEELTPILSHMILSQGLSAARLNGHGAIAVFPTHDTSLTQIMERYDVFEIMRCRQLVLKLDGVQSYAVSH